MAWPTPQDYNEAVQNPGYSFSDPELQSASCELTALGLPKPITGNFASVYHLRCQGREWAVRCFWRELQDMQQRYAAISAHLAAAALPYTVRFEYQSQGIRIRGSWYPILKMEWVEGQLLHDFLASHLHDPVALRSLTERWQRLVTDLERSGCAHGDLQHGNILVVKGELKLVDYDGMFVPALAGMGSHELGQQHYQHPRRGAADFNPQLDRFSTWVIYVSLRALQLDPSLWTATQAGDERLLLRKQDFEEPASSAALALLTEHPDAELQALALKFQALLREPMAAIPSLSSALGHAVSPGGPGAVAVTDLPRLLWRSIVPSVQGTTAHECIPVTSHPTWIIDYLPARHAEPALRTDQHADRARAAMLAALPMAGVGMVGMLAVGVPTIAASILLVLLWGMVSVAICIAAYRREPAVRRVLPLVRREIHALRGIAAAERAARDIAAKREVTLRQLSRDREDASKRSGELQQQEKRKLDALLESLTAKLETIDRRIYDVDRREVEQTELALQELQQRHIGEALRRASLRTASIPGVGPAVKMRLWALGVWAAADVSSDRIGSMQHLKHEHVMEVVAWRVGTETGARRTMPRELPIALKGPLHERYARERLNFVAKRSEEEAIVHGAMAEVRDTFAQRHAWAEERLTERLREGAAMLARLEDQLIRVGAEQQAQQSLLEAVRLEIAECEGVSFQQFLRSIFRLRIREKSA